ncbi:MAG: hypothetical protein AAFQ17_01795 [Pseudomonadota bacterium]
MRPICVGVLIALLASSAQAVVVAGSSFEINFDSTVTSDTVDGSGNIVQRSGGIDDLLDRPNAINPNTGESYGAGVPITGDTAVGGFFQDRGFFDDRFGVTFQSADSPLTLFNANCDPADVGVFDTCTGGDPDLGTGPYFGTQERGLTLIAQERTFNGQGVPNANQDRIAGSGTPEWWANPDDDFPNGYDIVANFRTTDPDPNDPNDVFFENGVTIDEIVLIDQEDTEDVTFFATNLDGVRYQLDESWFRVTNIEVGTPNVAGGGTANGADNDVLTVAFDFGTTNLQAFEVVFTGSGALEVIAFTASGNPVVPLPPAGFLMLGGLGLLAWRARSKRA